MPLCLQEHPANSHFRLHSGLHWAQVDPPLFAFLISSTGKQVIPWNHKDAQLLVLAYLRKRCQMFKDIPVLPCSFWSYEAESEITWAHLESHSLSLTASANPWPLKEMSLQGMTEKAKLSCLVLFHWCHCSWLCNLWRFHTAPAKSTQQQIMLLAHKLDSLATGIPLTRIQGWHLYQV